MQLYGDKLSDSPNLTGARGARVKAQNDGER